MMFRLLYRRYILPASILSGTIIGAGVFALPYIFVRSGWLSGALYLVVLTMVVALVHVMFAEVILHSGKEYRFVGYIRNYLGNGAFRISLLTSLIGLLLTLTVYLVLGVSFLSLLYPEGGELEKAIVFWAMCSLLVLVRVRILAVLEFWITSAVLAIIAAVFFWGAANAEQVLSLPLINIEHLFLPFGPILFSLMGRTAVPSVINYFSAAKEPISAIKRTIIGGSVVPSLFYFAFVVGVVGISEAVSADSVSGLVNSAPPLLLKAIGVLGTFTLFSTYIVLGIDVSKNLELDLKFPKILALSSVIALPLVFYVLGFKSFIGLVSLIGGVFIALEGAFIVLMWRKIAPQTGKRNALVFLLLAAFLLGALYEIIDAIA